MAKCLDYAKIAYASYFNSTNQYYADPPGHMVDDWGVQRWKAGSFNIFKSGYQGGIWQNATDVVVGCCGTNTKQTGKLIRDIGADIEIVLRMIPAQANSARKLVQAAKGIANGRMVSVTGHSLGGGLAQVAGLWEDVPFVTFNAPAMAHAVKASKFNLLKPQVMMRTRNSKKVNDTEGVNFRIAGDPVSIHGIAGGHIGMVVDLRNATGGGAHGKDNCWQAVLETDWAFIDPFGE